MIVAIVNSDPNQLQTSSEPVRHSIARAIVYGVISFIVGTIFAVLINVRGVPSLLIRLGVVVCGVLLARKLEEGSNARKAARTAEIATKPELDVVPFYRQSLYWGLILFFLPAIIGLIILLTGDIYKRVGDKYVVTFSKNERIVVAIIVGISQISLLLRIMGINFS